MSRNDHHDHDDTETLNPETAGDTSPAEPSEARSDNGPESETDILRGELEKTRAEAADFRDRFLRARADLENYRRRAAADVQRARDAGLDSAILPLLSVFDDLGRALGVATDDPGKLIPGIQGVRDGLKRNLESLGMVEIGTKGEPFNPDLHEALTAVPTQDEQASNTIAEVVQVGFTRDERLVRPARVVVYQS